MLKFARNTLAGVCRKDKDTLSVHGVLEDDIYGLEVDLELSFPGLEILSVRGEWKRMENSQCPRAIPFLQETVGFRVDGDFVRKVQKTVGRKACRHFADLIVECGDAAKESVRIIGVEEAKVQKFDIEIGDLFVKPEKRGETETVSPRAETGQRGEEPFAGMLIDIHVHSYPASPCSSLSVREIIEEAKAAGLDGICLTDHGYLWNPADVEELRQKHGFLVLRGNEVTTEQGDILVFGLEEDIKGVIKMDELREKVLAAGGFMVVAHPFRGFLTFGVGYLGLTTEKAMARPVFQQVDAVEVLNVKVSAEENNFAAQVAKGLGLPVTGGSDAHSAGEVGVYATRFPAVIRNERDFLNALRAGNFSPVSRRNR